MNKQAVEQHQNHHEADRHHHFEPRLRLLQFLEFTGPGDAVAVRQRHIARDPLLGFRDRRAEIAAAHAELDGDVSGVSFMKDIGSAGVDRDVRDLAQRDIGIRTARCREPDLDTADRIEGAAVFRCKPDRNVELAVRL